MLFPLYSYIFFQMFSALETKDERSAYSTQCMEKLLWYAMLAIMNNTELFRF
jgi:hypothetical protein